MLLKINPINSILDRSNVFLQMTFASEQLYKGYLRRNMPTIVSKVKVREIVPHLLCLTDHDRVGTPSKAVSTQQRNGKRI